MAEDGAGRTVCVYLENACGHLLAFSDELITVARELKKAVWIYHFRAGFVLWECVEKSSA